MELAEAMHQRGLCQDPHVAQDDYSDLPAVFIDDMGDTITNAYCLSIIDEQREDESHPQVFIRAVCRGTYAETEKMAGQLFMMLHDQTNYPLTARTSVLLSRRVLRSRAAHDQNDRRTRVDTYMVQPKAG